MQEIFNKLSETKKTVDYLVKRLELVEKSLHGSNEFALPALVAGQLFSSSEEPLNKLPTESWAQVASRNSLYNRTADHFDIVNNVFLDLNERKRKQNCLIVFGLQRNDFDDDLKKMKDLITLNLAIE